MQCARVYSYCILLKSVQKHKGVPKRQPLEIAIPWYASELEPALMFYTNYSANLCAHAPCHASRSSCLNFGSVWLPLSHGLLGPATWTRYI